MTSYDRLLGPAFEEFGWVPAPRYLMRRARIMSLMHELPPGKVLEVGPGAGTLLTEFAAQGFACEALEMSAQARQLATKIIEASGQHIKIHDQSNPDWHNGFDYIFAFDVLEHIQDDSAALLEWISWLKPGGRLILSVPARMSLWTAGDEWAGHFRRYEKTQLLAMLRGAPLEVDAFECYGFPLTNVTERFSASLYRKHIHKSAGTMTESRKKNNDRSGIDRRPHLRIFPLMRSWPGRFALGCFLALQKLFLDQDLGSGYVLVARKNEAT